MQVFTESTTSSTKCLQNVTITFNTDTNAPEVELSSLISNVVSFDPPHLDLAEKYGRWLDYRTLVVIFAGECVEVVMETTSGKAQPIFVAFIAEQGENIRYSLLHSRILFTLLSCGAIFLHIFLFCVLTMPLSI